jgi:hypothetical protein
MTEEIKKRRKKMTSSSVSSKNGSLAKLFNKLLRHIIGEEKEVSIDYVEEPFFELDQKNNEMYFVHIVDQSHRMTELVRNEYGGRMPLSCNNVVVYMKRQGFLYVRYMGPISDDE